MQSSTAYFLTIDCKRQKNDILLNMDQKRATQSITTQQRATLSITLFWSIVFTLHVQHVYSWFKTYLHNRFLSLSINGATSNKFETKFGVPQGSCLGLLLFMLYTSKLFKIIERHLPDVHAYADDTQLYISFNANFNNEQLASVQAIESCVADISEWIVSDRLKMSDDKTVCHYWNKTATRQGQHRLFDGG